MRNWFINPRTRAIVKKRSGGVCETCEEWPAVHMHHLTYKRAGRERQSDLLHICLLCHMDLHPEKGHGIAEFELNRSDEAFALADEQLNWMQEMEASNAQAEAQERDEADYMDRLMKQRDRDRWL